jgi:pimeloyl-ACP methyl ester carboxylesterase
MVARSRRGPRRELSRERSREMLEIHERMLAGAAASRRYIEADGGRRVHLIEAGEGSPVLFLHGSSTSSLSLLPLIEHLEGVRAIAADRPGFGLSDPVQLPRERYRAAAVEFVDEVLDALALETATLAGNSMGGTWALWYALERPDRVRRLVLLGASPLLPGTRAPTPIRIVAAPVIGGVLARVKTNEKMIVRFMSSMGEKATIVGYPDLIQALVAAADDPVASSANLAELRAAISPLGFRRVLRLHNDDLQRLTVPVLLIWGDRDPVGAVEVGRATAKLLPKAELEVLPAGHVSYLGNPEQAGQLLSAFVGAEDHWAAA